MMESVDAALGLKRKSDSIYAVMMIPIVVDTSVFVAALRSGGGASRRVLRKAIEGVYRPLFSNALWLEYEALLARHAWTAETTAQEREQVLAALAASGEWVKIYYGWRPNLRDEGDNHLIELAVAGGAQAIVTHNVKDLRSGELRWTGIKILTPAACLETLT
jgi:putative PIN family toxin of toxin-antitoxin system